MPENRHAGAPLTAEDLGHLRRAVELARRGRYGAPPNPMVGTVLVRGGRVVGEGFHARAGQDHAEAAALAAARADGQELAGSTAYVSLEPCSHQGRTPPCSDALVAAGVARVVALHGDPDPRVAGGGMARLREAGLDATLTTAAGAWPPELAADAAALVERALAMNLHFLVPAVLGRPAVTLKWAMSLDGRIATAGGDSQWISSPRGRRWSLDLRERHDAILVGSGTALADDPRLDRRLGLAPGPITRVILDRRLRLPPTARTLALDGPVLVYTAAGADGGRAAALEAAGATVIRLPQSAAGSDAGSNAAMPAAVLSDLAERGVRSLLVEGGGEVAASWLASGLYDRVHASVAPLLIGGRDAPGPLGGAGAEPLAAAPRLTDLHVRRRGPDVILTGLREQCLPELSSSVGAS